MSFWRELRVRVRGPLLAKVHAAAERSGLSVSDWHRRTLIAATHDPSTDDGIAAHDQVEALRARLRHAESIAARLRHAESIAEGLRQRVRDLEPLARLGRVVVREAKSIMENGAE